MREIRNLNTTCPYSHILQQNQPASPRDPPHPLLVPRNAPPPSLGMLLLPLSRSYLSSVTVYLASPKLDHEQVRGCDFYLHS